MILVATVAEVLEEYTVLLARVVEQLFRSAPVPRRFELVHYLDPVLSRHSFSNSQFPVTHGLP
ncbi:hypothetical protein CR513_21106, partial [Mucuna pruriens]